MGIASTAFAPEGNDITKGGRAFRVNLVRVGRMVPAARDTYRRVYRDDGTYHYPQIASNRLRRKGEPYFKSMEITGSNPGTAKEPKFDLLSFYRDTELPRLDALCAEVAAVTGKSKVVVRYQKDSAGPHTDGALNDFLNEKFQKRNLLLKFQPSNSPVCNIKDDCLFPALSKHISCEQGISKGSQVFAPDELWAAVTKCWEKFPLDTLARSYVRHSQIASAIAQCNGGDEFVRERNGLHCHVRNCCVTVCGEDGKPTGVEVVNAYDGIDDEVIWQRLRYEPPDVEPSFAENLARMTPEEIECLFNGLDRDHPWFNAVVTAYVATDPSAFDEGDAVHR